MPADLPIKNATENLPPMAKPNPSGKQTATQDTVEDVARWNLESKIRPALAELIAVFDRHPELLEWARASAKQSVQMKP